MQMEEETIASQLGWGVGEGGRHSCRGMFEGCLESATFKGKVREGWEHGRSPLGGTEGTVLPLRAPSGVGPSGLLEQVRQRDTPGTEAARCLREALAWVLPA